ncbi:MAG: hypothetical protein KMY52_08350 [Methanobacterium sp.]|nr:hypothetical protein [Methanobacterium sp.]
MKDSPSSIFVEGAPATNNLLENYYSTSLKTHRKKTTKNRQRNNKPHEAFGHEKSRTNHQQRKNNPPNVLKIHTLPKPRLNIKNKFLRTILKKNISTTTI